MKKSEIKIGDHIIFNNGQEFISMGESWNNVTGWCNPSAWNEDLSYSNEHRPEWSIKQVWRPYHFHAYLKYLADDDEEFELIYQEATDKIEESSIIEAVANIKTEIALVGDALDSLAIKLEKLYDQSQQV